MSKITLPILALVFAACITTRSTLLNPTAQAYPPVAPDSVLIFVDVAELDSLEYVRVAIINASGSTTYTSQSGMLEAMRKKAGAVGANAIIMPEIRNPSAGAEVAGAIFGTGTLRRGEVIAIRILGPKTDGDR